MASILLLTVALLGAGFVSYIKGNVSEARADTDTYTLSFIDGDPNFRNYEVPRSYDMYERYTDTKQFGSLEWSLVINPSDTSNLTIDANPTWSPNSLQLGENGETADYARLRTQIIGGEKPVVTAIDITMAGAYDNSSCEVTTLWWGEYSFERVTDQKKIVNIDGTEETIINFILGASEREIGAEGAFGEIYIDFNNIKNGISLKSIQLTLSTYSPEGFLHEEYEMYAFASRVQLANPCEEAGMTTLISEYDAFVVDPAYSSCANIQFYDRAEVDGPRTIKTSVGEKMDYIKSRYGGGQSPANVVNVETASSNIVVIAVITGTGFVAIALGATLLLIAKKKR